MKASTLFKHTFKCSSSQSTDSQQKDHIATVSDPKKNRKSRTNDRESHIKSEPEANLDMDVSTSHILTSDMLPVVVLTKTIFKPNHSVAINAEDMSIKTENDFDCEDNLQMDEPFRDADDSDDNDEAEQMNGVGSAMDAIESFSDDDVILIENNEEPVLINGSPSAIRNPVEKPFVLPIVIKREPVDNYEAIAPPVFDPTKKIKTEPLDESTEMSNEVEKQFSPKRRRSKKSTHKSYKERPHLVHIKEEPMETDDLRNDVFRMAPKHNLGSAIVSLPTTNLLETTIKQEPIRCGYGDDFDPVLAMNIKKEPGLDDSSSSRLPSLRLIISKKHGTLNAKLISAQGEDTENVEQSPKATKTKRVKDKRLYKKPALLAEKIRQEMIARMARDKENKTTSHQSLDAPNDFIVPVIARVLDATTISDLPLVRVKVEPKSPFHSSYHNSESILDSLCREPIPSGSPRDPIHEFRYDQFGDDIDALPSADDNDCISAMAGFNTLDGCFNDAATVDTRESADEVGLVNMERNSEVTESEELKSALDIESLCQLRPIGGSETVEAIRKEIADADNMSYCENEQINESRSTNEDAANKGLIELAGMTLNEYMKQSSSEESNGQIALESTDFSDQVSNVLIENSQNHFDPIPFNDTDHLTVNKDTFKIPGEHKVSYEVINEIISTLPLSAEENMVKEVISLNSTDESTVVVNDSSTASDILSSKEKSDGKCSVFSDSSESNKINYSTVNAHSRSESHVENSSICNEMPDNEKLKSTERFLANGDDDVENELLKSPVNDNTDYELNSVQTLTTSAIHEQLHSLLEDISEDSLSCDIDLDDKTVDWEWESKLLGD